MRHARPLALSALAIALLPGCDILEKIPRTPEDFARAASPFGAATRELLEDSPEGKVYRIMIESKRTASWAQADFAMWQDLRSSCPDGAQHENLSTEPATDGAHESSQQEHPAGTHFIRTFRCAPKPAYQFEFESRLPHEQAVEQMTRRLREAAPDSKGGRVVVPILDSSTDTKFDQIEGFLGGLVHSMLNKCPTGVVVSHPVIGLFPPSDEASDLSQPLGYFAYIVECTGNAPATAAAPIPGK
ncbi:hypothetical protein [Arenimonas metalli]|uniref:Uncharacterized protein n=1 Tax=Arenimonas metalli CF5-1 TaxID=1384056 RepID=A0A091B3Y0_9GAMM|nr:hypothetical protein [Arenimonas metalli]KFN45549.1 hypothetical protein N787_12715 [Arenimonas metalli CF5-1]